MNLFQNKATNFAIGNRQWETAVKKTSLDYRGVFEAINCGEKYKHIVVSSLLFVFQYKYLCFLYVLYRGEKFQSIFLAGSLSKSMLHLKMGTAL